MAAANPQEMNSFVRVVDEFMQNFAKLNLSATRKAVYESGNSALIDDYETTFDRAQTLKAAIEATTGTWQAAKRGYAVVTSETSMLIGDAIDTVRSWFGYKPAGDLGRYAAVPISAGQLGALSAIQLPAAAWVAGIISAAYLLNQAMKRVMLQIDAAKLQRDNPAMPYNKAIELAKTASRGPGLFGLSTVPLILGGALALWLLLGKKK